MLKKILLLFFGLIFISSGFYYVIRQPGVFKKTIVYKNSYQESKTTNLNKDEDTMDNSIIIDNLKIPWETLFLPEGDILITERTGRITVLKNNTHTTINVDGVKHVGEGGLLGAALHPNFKVNKYIYLFFTTEESGVLSNKIFRYTLEDYKLSGATLILEGIRGSSNHDGGRIAFGPDNLLYITTGDAEEPNSAQDTKSLNGKILRINDDGSIPPDNPFNNPVYSYGHRNPQGITWDENGNLWATEHGPSGLNTGWDELNLIVKGSNYGWPLIKGDETKEGMQNPVIHSGKSTWAPASAVYYRGSILFGGLRGEALYEYDIEKKILKENFKKEYGRIRNVAINREGTIFISTSNTDGRGVKRQNDDKVIQVRINRDTVNETESELPTPPQSYKIKLPNHYYQSFNNCGPATLSLVLNYYGQPTTQQEIGNILRPYQNIKGDNDDKSVSLEEMAEEAEKRSNLAYHRANGDINLIQQLTSNGIPVIVTTWLKSNEDIGHYRVITGYDSQKMIIYQDDSFQGPNRSYSFDEFLALWQPFNYQYLVIAPTEKMPLINKILGSNLDIVNNWKNTLTRGIEEENINTQNPYPIFNQAVANYYLSNFDKAINLYEKVATRLPKRMLWYQPELIDAYIKTGQYSTANSMIDSILNSGNKAYSELYILRGDIFLKQNDIDSARHEYETAVQYNINLKSAQERLQTL